MSIPEMVVIVGALTQYLKIKQGISFTGYKAILMSVGVTAAVLGYYYLKMYGITPATMFIEVLVGANAGYQILKKR